MRPTLRFPGGLVVMIQTNETTIDEVDPITHLQSEDLDDFIAYGDFNCPFCFALHERLAAWGVLDRIEWRLIVHAPELSETSFSLEDQSLLANEVFAIHHRAPDVPVNLPRTRPGTESATRMMIAAGKQSPKAEVALRLSIYRALWHEGRNIADSSVLQQIANEAGVGDLFSSGNVNNRNVVEDSETLPVWQFWQQLGSAPAELIKWQTDWETNKVFDRRIPILARRSSKSLLLGLPTEEALYQFLLGRREHFVNQDVCVFQPRPIAVVYGSTERVWSLVKVVRQSCEILHFSDFDTCKKTLVESENTDFLLIEHEFANDLVLKELTQLCISRGLIWVLTSRVGSDDAEIRALHAGAAEYLPLDRSEPVLKSRIDKLVTDRRKTVSMERDARMDGLTQVANRREFQFRIEQEWQRLTERGTGNCSLLLVDIDHFKSYNDTYGHLAGDGCLKKVASVLSDRVERLSDVVARYGGEEFVVLLPETILDHAEIVAERLRGAVEQEHIEHKASETHEVVTVSIGVATGDPVRVRTAGDLIRAADDRLYRAKAEGRNCVVSRLD